MSRPSLLSLLVVFVAGTLVGGVNSVHAQQQLGYFFFLSAQRFLEPSQTTFFQLGYAAGVTDGLQEATKEADFLLSDPQDPRTTVWRTSRVYRAVACKNQRYAASLTQGQAREVLFQHARLRSADAYKPMAEIAADAFAALCS